MTAWNEGRSTIYEWVVETMDRPEGGDEADREILECSYWDEKHRAQADADFASILAEGGFADFGICRRQGDDIEGETDRQYLYRNADGSWPADREMDGGAVVPKRIKL